MRRAKIVLSFTLLIAILMQLAMITYANDNDSSNDSNNITLVQGTTKKNADYIIKFSSSQSNKLITCDEMSTLLGQPIANGGDYEIENTTNGAKVAYNDDGSITLSKASTLYGANLEVPITDEMKQEYLKNTSHTLTASFYLSKSLNTDNLFTDTQIRVYARFKNTGTITVEDESYTSYLKASSLKSVYAKAYQPFIDKQFQLVDFDDNTLENLDNVKSIIISLYQFEYTQATLEFSGICTENSSPDLKEYQKPNPESPVKSAPILKYRREYDKKWAGHPSTVKYSSSGGFDASQYKTTEIGDLYFKNINEVSSKQLAIYYDFDIDEFNKGIVSANQEGGSKQAYLVLNVAKINDVDDKEMMAEFELQFFMFDGEVITLEKSWVKQNDNRIIKFDISNIDVNDVSHVKVSVQNYWKYCAEDGKYYDYDKKTEKDGRIYCSDHLGNENVDITDKTLTNRIMKNVEVFISAIKTVAEGVEETSAVQNSTTAANSSDDYEYAGYHFIDFKQEALDETYGNNPSNVDFFFSDYYQRYSLENHNYKDNNSSGTKVTGDKKYLSDYKTASEMSSGGYQLQLNSGFEKTQPQYQSSYWKSGKVEDENRVKETQDHKPLKAQGEKYDYSTQMTNAVKYANDNPDPKIKGYLAIDVYVVSSTHGYKNTHNTTYKNWCKKNKKTCADEDSTAQIQVMIHAKDKKGEDCSVETMAEILPGKKTTLFLDVSELSVSNVSNVRVVAQNYGNLANQEQGGNNNMCGITNVTARYSAIYVPGNKQSENITTTVDVTRPFSEKDAKYIKKLYDALPGFSVDDYETFEDYQKLSDFQKAWTEASIATQEYCEKEYNIDYAKISMLEAEVYDKLVANGEMTADGYDASPETGDISLPVLYLVLFVISSIVVFKTMKKKSK